MATAVLPGVVAQLLGPVSCSFSSGTGRGVGYGRRVGVCRPRVSPLFSPGIRSSSRVSAWFKFGKARVDAEESGMYGSQGREDYDRDDVEHYFNYMGMLAVEGTYDKLEALLGTGIHPVDLLLLMAASEGDRPKIQELLKAGARCDVQNADGKTALDLATDEEVRDLIRQGAQSAV